MIDGRNTVVGQQQLAEHLVGSAGGREMEEASANVAAEHRSGGASGRVERIGDAVALVLEC